MPDLTLIQKIAIWALPILFAITAHEVAHGWVAYKLGDKTAFMLGRLTLNPLKHIDPIGTVIVPLVLLFLGGFIFGWAKPVPVNQRYLHKPRRDMALVALAGPTANLIMAILWVVIAKLGSLFYHGGMGAAMAVVLMGEAGLIINLVLLVLNILPIPPLDGSRVLSSLLPVRWSVAYDKLGTIGFFILIALLALGWLSHVIAPPVLYLRDLLQTLVGLH